MARALTQAQLKRRGAILNWLRGLRATEDGWRTTTAIRAYVAAHFRLFVGEDTVARDLKAMKSAGSIVAGILPFTRGRRRWRAISDA